MKRPVAWPMVRLRSISAIRSGGTPTPDEGNWEGEIPFVTPPDLRPVHGSVCRETARHITSAGLASGSSLAPRGAVLVSKRAPIGYVARLPLAAAFNQGCLAVVPMPSKVDAGFLTWSMSVRAEEMNVLGRGTTFTEIAAGDLGNLIFALPPLGEQRAIADYLDRETAQIDALIGKQERLIETLRDRRAAVVERTVTANQQISTTRLKHFVVAVKQGWSPQCYPWPADGIKTWAVLKAGAANAGRFRPMENKELPEDETPRPEAVVEAGQLLVSRANTRELVGSAAVVSGEHPRLMLCDKLYAFTLDPTRALPEYVARTLGTRRWRDLIEMEAVGTSPSMQNISQSAIVNLPMALPSLDDQRRLAAFLDEETAKIDALIAKAERLIEVSKERRAAIITAAVTGQIDVRESGGVSEAQSEEAGESRSVEQKVQPA